MTHVRTFLTAIVFALLLSACTAGRPPRAYLPSADSIVAGETVTVGRNENVYTVAQKYGVNMREIIVLNDLKPPFALKPGQKLTLPNKDRYAAPTPQAAPLDPIDKGYIGPSSTSVSTSSLTSQPLPPPSSGVVSAGPVVASVVEMPLPPAADTVGATESTNFSSGTEPVSATRVREINVPALAPKIEEPASVTAPSSPPITEAAPAVSASTTAANSAVPAFAWPVRGTVISAFGPKGKGLDNDGINIAAPKGAPVKAADGGMVAYAGNEMKGFGNLVLIRHEGGWVTAYAHLDRMVVAKDTIVAKGDMIGTVGTTGGVGSPQLHFEARRDGGPVDPELVLK